MTVRAASSSSPVRRIVSSAPAVSELPAPEGSVPPEDDFVDSPFPFDHAEVTSEVPGVTVDRLGFEERAPLPVSTEETSSALRYLGPVASPREREVFLELYRAHPCAESALDALLPCTKDWDPPALARLAKMYPASGASSRVRALATDFADAVPGETGRTLGEAIVHGLAARGVSETEIDAFMRCVADVRAGFKAMAASEPFQASNWIHTRVEILHTLEAAEALQLGPEQTLVTVLGSLFSDSFKDSSSHSLLIHNRLGAELALPLVMRRHFEFPRHDALLRQAMRVAHEHQITPPAIMMGALAARLGEGPGRDEVLTRVGDPLHAPQAGGEIRFSAEAMKLLQEAGVPGWAVPDPRSDHFLSSLATIYGDVCQYAGPDGIDKIARVLRGPHIGPPFNRSPDLKHAVEHTVRQFDSGLKLVLDALELAGESADHPELYRNASKALAKLGEKHRKQCRESLDTSIYPLMEKRLREAMPGVTIPYWDSPVSTTEMPGELELKAVEDVRRIFGEVLAEVGPIPWALF